MDYFIGREQEIQLLERIYTENRSSFIAIYGRRRVGKTELIRHVFGVRMTFYLTGIGNVTTDQQLVNFQSAFERQAPLSLHRTMPINWFFAFSRNVIKF